MDLLALNATRTTLLCHPPGFGNGLFTINAVQQGHGQYPRPTFRSSRDCDVVVPLGLIICPVDYITHGAPPEWSG